MTILLTTCFAFAILRCIEEHVRRSFNGGWIRFCINYISGLTTRKKIEEVSVPELKRISAYIPLEIHAVLKDVIQKMGYTMNDYILLSVNEQIKKDIKREKLERISHVK